MSLCEGEEERDMHTEREIERERQRYENRSLDAMVVIKNERIGGLYLCCFLVSMF